MRKLQFSVICASLILLLASATQATVSSYSFNLVGPQTTGDGAGNTIQTTGSGSFDTQAETVVASGSFNSTGGVVTKGTWTATGFVSFQPFGGPNPGLQGGVLQILVTMSFASGGQETNVPMSVTCRIHAPSGFTGEEGITIGSFTKVIRGATLFHLND